MPSACKSGHGLYSQHLMASCTSRGLIPPCETGDLTTAGISNSVQNTSTEMSIQADGNLFKRTTHLQVAAYQVAKTVRQTGT